MLSYRTRMQKATRRERWEAVRRAAKRVCDLDCDDGEEEKEAEENRVDADEEDEDPDIMKGLE